ncbi:MAG TPA: chromosomal replication initiator protein DnaA [Solirubrobacteraceae bacterium]|nr:chromosomal replication initiator protein DnaA [Solirubrobacteraceae bacterium]
MSAWSRLGAELESRVGNSAFEIWLAPLRSESFDGRTLALTAPPDTGGWLIGRYGAVIAAACTAALGDDVRVVIDGLLAGGEQRPASVAAPRSSGRPRRPTDAEPGGPAGTAGSPLNPRYRFEQFIIGRGNHLAHAAALAVAENPGQAYNPLFLYAPPGMGKTHLLHAIGNFVCAYSPDAVVRLASAESFTNHFITALNARGLAEFKRAYRDADVLLLDDVQFLASKAKTEEEFFHTFNALYENGRQLVLTCDRLPRALTAIEQRLRERFEAGLVAEIAPPDHDTRVAILCKRAALDNVRIGDPEVLELIAERVTDNIRALEGALIRVVAFHSLTGRPIDPALTAEVLDTMYPVRSERRPGSRGARGQHSEALSGGRPVGSQPPTIAEIQATVAAAFDLTVEELVSSSRAARVNWPRQLAIQLARDLTHASLPTIGRAFGGRNHATVLHACRRVSERLTTDQAAVHDLTRLRGQLSTDPDDRGC